MIIYKATNKNSGKPYIGQTIRSLEQRIAQHLRNRKGNNLFHRALLKYGLENFDFETMAYCDTKKKLNFLECFYVKFYNSKTPNGYNLTDGGGGVSGYIATVEARKKRSEVQKGRHPTEESRKKMSVTHAGEKSAWWGKFGEKHPNWGRHPSEETRRKRSAAMTGKVFTKEHREKIRVALTGKIRTEEHCKNLSKAHKGKQTGEKNPNFGKHPIVWNKGLKGFMAGEKNPMFGKKFTEEHCRKISEAKRRRIIES